MTGLPKALVSKNSLTFGASAANCEGSFNVLRDVTGVIPDHFFRGLRLR